MLTFGSLSPAVTLKIKSRSPKPNQLNHDGQMLYPACKFCKKKKKYTFYENLLRKQKSVIPMQTGLVQK